LPDAPRVVIRVAAGVLEDVQGRVLIARRPPDKHAGGAWEFPGGKLLDSELPRAALDRELTEELGIHVTGAEPLIEYTHRYPDRDVVLHVFRVTAWQGEPRSAEDQPLRWVEAADLPGAGLLPADRPIVAALRAISRP
jgi:8-oxo-dGTP diphosphatase